MKKRSLILLTAPLSSKKRTLQTLFKLLRKFADGFAAADGYDLKQVSHLNSSAT